MPRAVERVGYAVAIPLLLSGLIHVGVLIAGGGSWEGPLSLRKAATFGISFGITLLTIVWVTSWLRLGDRARTLLLGAFIVACVLEMFLVSMHSFVNESSQGFSSSSFALLCAASSQGARASAFPARQRRRRSRAQSTLLALRMCLPETQSACQFAHSPWELNVRRVVNSLCRRKDADVAAREVENGDEIGRRRAGAAAASCLAVGVRRSCAPSRQRRQVFRPRAVRSDDASHRLPGSRRWQHHRRPT
jgi:hypothetical protein